MRKSIFTYFTIGIAVFCFSFGVQQKTDWKEISMEEYDRIVEKASTFFADKISYSVTTTISSYRTHTDAIPFETQKGTMLKSGKNYHSHMLGMDTYQNRKYRFVVDSTEKNIMIANPSTEKEDDMMMSQYKTFRTYIEKAYTVTTANGIKLKAVLKEKAKISTIEMDLDKNGFLKKSVTYFRVKLNDDPDNQHSKSTAPRIETVLSDYRTYEKVDYEKEFGESRFFILADGKFSPKEKYKSFYIKDTRLK